MNRLSEYQLKAGKEVLKAYEKGDKPWHLLFAQPQSGKTDTFLFIGAEMIRQEKVSNIVILSGVDDKQLKKQCVETLLSSEGAMDFSEKYDRYLELELCQTREERFKIRSELKKRTHFIWGNELVKQNSYRRDTLFIWEESHYAQTINMRPFKFLTEIGINCDGSEVRNNNYVLSVSATPFSEISHILNSIEEPNKGKTFLETNEKYHSIEKILKKNLLSAINPKELISHLDEILNEYDTEKTTYGIIRAANEKKSLEISKVAKRKGWEILKCDSNPKSELKNLSILKTEPIKNTLIIIKGMCRMGQVLHKEHLSFVIETSNETNSETLIQGLLGRTLGWHNNEIRVYISYKDYEREDLNKYLEMISGKKVLPKKAYHLNKHGKTNNRDVFSGEKELPGVYVDWLKEFKNM